MFVGITFLCLKKQNKKKLLESILLYMNVSSKQNQFDQISKVNPGQTAAKNWVDINRNCILAGYYCL